jgi:hypothetical protein
LDECFLARSGTICQLRLESPDSSMAVAAHVRHTSVDIELEIFWMMAF